MKAMIALETIIHDLELRIKTAREQLARHESGEKKLTLLSKSSAENNLELHKPLVEHYKALLKEFEKFEKLDCFEHRRLKAAIERKKYYKFNKQEKNKKKVRYKENDENIEAAMIIDELPDETILDEEELYRISFATLQDYIPYHSDAKEELISIQNEFNNLIKNFTDENIRSLELLNYMIPILIFHLNLFKMNLQEEQTYQEQAENIDVSFFPKYHDWWIDELWTSHIAYFSIFKWKKDISLLCRTQKQKQAWRILFNNWIFVKTLLSEKSNLAFEYQYIFDTLINKYVNLTSELNKDVIEKEKEAIKYFIKEENILSLSSEHNVLTPYIHYKKDIH